MGPPGLVMLALADGRVRRYFATRPLRVLSSRYDQVTAA